MPSEWMQPINQLFDTVVVKDQERIEKRLEETKTNMVIMYNMALVRTLVEKKAEFCLLLNKTGSAVGDCLRLAAKFKYQVQEQHSGLNQLMGQLQRMSQQPQAPVINVQSPQPQASSSVGFWGGLWDLRRTAALLKVKTEEEPRPVVALEDKVIDEIRTLGEVRPQLNQFSDRVFYCYRRYERHPNEWIVKYLHFLAERDLNKIGLMLVGAADWASRMEIQETRSMGIAIGVAAARVAEAEAMARDSYSRLHDFAEGNRSGMRDHEGRPKIIKRTI